MCGGEHPRACSTPGASHRTADGVFDPGSSNSPGRQFAWRPPSREGSCDAHGRKRARLAPCPFSVTAGCIPAPERVGGLSVQRGIRDFTLCDGRSMTTPAVEKNGARAPLFFPTLSYVAIWLLSNSVCSNCEAVVSAATLNVASAGPFPPPVGSTCSVAVVPETVK